MEVTYQGAVKLAKELLLQNYKINIDDYSVGELYDMMNLLIFAVHGRKDMAG